MNKRILFVVLFFKVFAVFAEEAPQMYSQDGYAIVQGTRIHYWLYDTISSHNGIADEIYNRYIPYWIEEMKYVIDYDHIEKYDPNPGLASSVKALMEQKACDVSVALITDHPIYEYVVINEKVKGTGVYKTTVYPLYDYTGENRNNVNGFKYFDATVPRGIVDLGLMSESIGSQRVEKEFEDFNKKSGGEFKYGSWNDLTEDSFQALYAFIYTEYQKPQGHLFKVWFDNWQDSYNGRIGVVGFVHWITDNNISTYMLSLLH
jgi:hypothetical protein